MAIFISLLRGINVGGQRNVPMAELREVYSAAGLRKVKTYIQSGNVIFESPETEEAALVSGLEGQIAASFGFPVSVVIRNLEEWRRLARRHPFSEGADPAHLHVACLAEEPGANAVRDLAAVDARGDRFKVVGREVYLHCPNGMARTKLNNATLERKLGTAATMRNWKTVGKLLELGEAAA